MGVEGLDREEWRPDIVTPPYSYFEVFKASTLAIILIYCSMLWFTCKIGWRRARLLNAKHSHESCTLIPLVVCAR